MGEPIRLELYLSLDETKFHNTTKNTTTTLNNSITDTHRQYEYYSIVQW